MMTLDTMQEIEKNLQISGTSQVTFGYDMGGGHTVEVFHSFKAMVGKPKSPNPKRKRQFFALLTPTTKSVS